LNSGPCSWATPSGFFALGIFEIVSWFMPWLAWTAIFLFVLSCLVRMTGCRHCT
jgi:hypothetical protein